MVQQKNKLLINHWKWSIPDNILLSSNFICFLYHFIHFHPVHIMNVVIVYTGQVTGPSQDHTEAKQTKKRRCSYTLIIVLD